MDGRETIENPPCRSWLVRAQAWLDFFGVPFVSVNVSCPREDFLRVGGFDPRFGKAYGWEDTELGVRLRLAGLGNVRNRRAYVLHHRDGTPTLESEMKKRRECGSNAALFYAKYPSAGSEEADFLGDAGCGCPPGKPGAGALGDAAAGCRLEG